MKNIIKTQFQGKLTSSSTLRQNVFPCSGQNQFSLNEHEIE